MKIKKILGICTLTASLLISSFSISFADSDYGYAGPAFCQGYVSMGSKSASATTTSSCSASCCVATITYYYTCAGASWIDVKTLSSQSASVCASQYATHTNGVVSSNYASGNHHVDYSGYSWNGGSNSY